MRTRSAIIVGLAVVAAALSGCGPKTVAKVNSDTITEEQFQSRLRDVDAYELSNSAQGGGPAKAAEFALQAMITDRVVLQLAESKKASPTDAQVADYIKFTNKFPSAAGRLAADPFRSDEAKKREARMQVAIRNIAMAPLGIKPADIEAQYKLMLPQLQEPAQLHLRVINNSSEANAAAVLKQLAAGISFETVAMKSSEDSVTRDKKGDIGFVPIPQLPPGADKLLAPLKDGEYTKTALKVMMSAQARPGAPATPAARYLVMQVVERKPGRTVPLDEVRPFVETSLLQVKDPNALQRVGQTVQEFMQKADISVSLAGYEDVAQKIKQSGAPGGPRPGGPPAPGGPGPAPAPGAMPGK